VKVGCRARARLPLTTGRVGAGRRGSRRQRARVWLGHITHLAHPGKCTPLDLHQKTPKQALGKSKPLCSQLRQCTRDLHISRYAPFLPAQGSLPVQLGPVWLRSLAGNTSFTGLARDGLTAPPGKWNWALPASRAQQLLRCRYGNFAALLGALKLVGSIAAMSPAKKLPRPGPPALSE